MSRTISIEQAWKKLAETARYRSDDLARLCRVSTRQLRRQFQRDLGCSPKDWLNERRIAAAEELLLSGRPMKEVACELGFKQTSHFCRVFKSLKQMTPSEFLSGSSRIRPMSRIDNKWPEEITAQR